MHAAFPSPCGVWVVSSNVVACESTCQFPSPCGVWVVSKRDAGGCAGAAVSVPLRGVGCFDMQMRHWSEIAVSVPLRGVGCFHYYGTPRADKVVSVPLRGVGCFIPVGAAITSYAVSVPLRGVGCFGKAAHSFWCNRKKNCQLCYFIVSYWQMFINSKLRNCKVPCEAHKTAT